MPKMRTPPSELLDLASRTAARAKKRGASEAEAFAELSREAGVRVRDGAIEDLTQATSKGLGLRVIVNGRLGFAHTSDLRKETLDDLAGRAVALAKLAAKDENNALPRDKALGAQPEVEGLFDPAVADVDPEWKVKAALEIERAAKGYDPRVAAIESVGAGENVVEVAIASTAGARGHYRGTYAYLYAAPVAKDGGQLQTAYWVDYKRRLDALERPEAVGREAARRAVRMLGARKVPTARVPVVFEPTIAAGFVASLAGAVNGDLVHKKSSFLAGKLGERIASELVSVYDDGLLPGGIATAPFDGEGVARRKLPIVERGVLRTYLYDTYTARKARAKGSTGSAARSYASLPSIGVSNFYLAAGATPPEEIVRGVKKGLLVTAMLGHGANVITGDYSRGANGLWIEGGEIAFPVQEITVAGNLLSMLGAVDAVGSDLLLRGSVGAPTIRFAELTVSGG